MFHKVVSCVALAATISSISVSASASPLNAANIVKGVQYLKGSDSAGLKKISFKEPMDRVGKRGEFHSELDAVMLGSVKTKGGKEVTLSVGKNSVFSGQIGMDRIVFVLSVEATEDIANSARFPGSFYMQAREAVQTNGLKDVAKEGLEYVMATNPGQFVIVRNINEVANARLTNPSYREGEFFMEAFQPRVSPHGKGPWFTNAHPFEIVHEGESALRAKVAETFRIELGIPKTATAGDLERIVIDFAAGIQ